jgi:hypothetical protein
MLRPRKISFLGARLIILQKEQRTYSHVIDKKHNKKVTGSKTELFQLVVTLNYISN